MKTVRFFSKQHTSEIFSRNETILENWKPIISWKVSLYMSDPRNVGQAKECSSSGKFVPRMCKYKFRCTKHSNAVHINIGKFDIPRKLDPGVITTILKSLGNSDENVYKFCADANKVTAGVDRNGGDIDMFGCESGTPLLQKQAVYEKVKSTLEFLIKLVSQNDNHIRHRDLHNKDGQVITTAMKSYIRIFSCRKQECRLLLSKQRFGLEHFYKYCR